jgi:repressor LexA
VYKDLTPRQLEILNYIKKELRTKGYPPSVREIGKAVGLSSSSTVHNHLNNLENKGYIKRDPTKPRAIEVMDHPKSFHEKELVNVPVLGRVTAGAPILAYENIEDTFSLPFEFLRSEDVFILHVKGDSMVNAGIYDGDMVIVRKQSVARNGEIVVALLDDEATVKRFFLESDHIRLQPENDKYEPLITKDATILGKVVALVRRYQ